MLEVGQIRLIYDECLFGDPLYYYKSRPCWILQIEDGSIQVLPFSTYARSWVRFEEGEGRLHRISYLLPQVVSIPAHIAGPLIGSLSPCTVLSRVLSCCSSHVRERERWRPLLDEWEALFPYDFYIVSRRFRRTIELIRQPRYRTGYLYA